MSLIALVTTIGMHIGSVHINPVQEFNDFNLGVYARTTDDVIAGVYLNSLNRPSVYAVKDFKLQYGFSVQAGLVSGYNALVLPAATLSYNINKNYRISYLPKTADTGAHVLHLTYEFK